MTLVGRPLKRFARNTKHLRTSAAEHARVTGNLSPGTRSRNARTDTERKRDRNWRKDVGQRSSEKKREVENEKGSEIRVYCHLLTAYVY